MSQRGLDHPDPPIAPVSDQAVIRLVSELPDVVIVIDGQGRVLWGNRAAERQFGRTLGSSIGMSGLELVHPEDLELVLLSLATIQDKVIGIPLEIRLATPNGWRLMELVGAPVPWLEEGSVLLSLRDLTDRRRYELAHDSDARFRTLVENAAVVTMLVSPAGVVESCSGALTRMLGHDPETVEGRPLVDLVIDDDRPAVDRALQRASQGAAVASPVTVTASLMRQGGGSSVPFELALVNLIEDPTVRGYVVSAHDVTDRKHLEEQLSYQAFHDSLTGLGNRALFRDRLDHALERSQRTDGRLATLFLDMDNLKVVNDSLGHAVGDSLLQAMAAILLGCIRKVDTAARLGGDEFGVIVEDFSHQDEVFALAERILEVCRRPMKLGPNSVSATVSIGFTFSKPGITVDELLCNADRAMYVAKDHGKNRYEEFEDWMLATVQTGR